jgi:cation diffusion facilitator family transporter
MQTNTKKEQIVKLSVFSNSFLVISKLIIGLISGSVSVISEAIHSAIDLIAALIAFFSVKNSSKPPDKEHRFGHGKIENVSGFLEAILIFIAAIWIIYEAFKKIIYPTEIEKIGLGIIVMLSSSILNFYVSRRLMKVALETDSIAIKADSLHLMTDVYTSLGVAGSLLLIWLMEFFFKGNHFHFLDPLCAILVAALIIKTAYKLTKEAFADLIDSSIPKEEIKLIEDKINSFADIMSYKSLKTRKSGGETFIEMDLIFDKRISLLKAHEITDNLIIEIKKDFPHSHINIHMEPCIDPCSISCKENCSKNN